MINMTNKKGKFKPHHIDLFGVRFCMPKGLRKIINKANPKLRGKKLNAKHLQTVINAAKEKR